jgi:hypothetical protein
MSDENPAFIEPTGTDGPPPIAPTVSAPPVDKDYEAYKAEKKAAQDKIDAEKAKQAERDKPESKLKKYEEEFRAWATEVGRHTNVMPPVHPDDVPAETDTTV